MLVFEDLHWVDPDTETIIEGIVDAAAGTRTLVLLNFRPEYRAELGGTHALPADRAAAARRGGRGRTARATGSAPTRRCRASSSWCAGAPAATPSSWKRWCRRRSSRAGSSARAGASASQRPIESIEVPASVQSLLAARIDRLDEASKRLLADGGGDRRRGGRDAVLERVAGLDRDTLRGGLRQLVQSEFLYEAALYPESEYAFKHPLTREVAYASLLRERRRALHAAVATALEALAGAAVDQRALLLAHHWEQAGRNLEAARWQARDGGAAGRERGGGDRPLAQGDGAARRRTRHPRRRARCSARRVPGWCMPRGAAAPRRRRWRASSPRPVASSATPTHSELAWMLGMLRRRAQRRRPGRRGTPSGCRGPGDGAAPRRPRAHRREPGHRRFAPPWQRVSRGERPIRRRDRSSVCQRSFTGRRARWLASGSHRVVACPSTRTCGRAAVPRWRRSWPTCAVASAIATTRSNRCRSITASRGCGRRVATRVGHSSTDGRRSTGRCSRRTSIRGPWGTQRAGAACSVRGDSTRPSSSSSGRWMLAIDRGIGKGMAACAGPAAPRRDPAAAR